jgi:hypothetical protein
MTTENKLVIAGVWEAEAKQAAMGTMSPALNLVTLGAGGVTGNGTGTIQSNSTALAAVTTQVTDDLIVIGTTGGAAANNTVQLTNQGAAFITLFNASANEVYVFPPTGSVINPGQTPVGGVANAGPGTINSSFGVGSQKSCTFLSPDGITWYAQHAG